MGCKVQIHEKPHHRRTYAPHLVYGLYLGPAVNRYRCYTCYNIDVGGEATPDTIALFPTFIKMTNFSYIDIVIRAAIDLVKAFQTTLQESPFQVEDSQLKEIS